MARNLAALAVDGRLVQIGLMGGEAAPHRFPPRARAPPDDHRLDAAAAHASPRRARLPRRCASEVWPLLEQGRVKPIIYRTFPLTDAAAAHRLMESSEHIGKIVLVA